MDDPGDATLFHLVLEAALSIALVLAAVLPGMAVAAEPVRQTIAVDIRAASKPFPHFWERMIGSGRAVLALRESWQRDLRDVKAVTGVQYLRFHGIFHDENGVYDEDAKGAPIYNFHYVDQIYDALLAAGVKPFVEISFMPRKLAREPRESPFWYRPIVSLPKDYVRWDGLVAAFGRHLVERYGLDEVAQWYFEVWNEPNLDSSWTQVTYFEFYDHTARALKAASPRLRVGGPSTAAAGWVGEMVEHARAVGAPLDFVSTHVYGDDKPETTLGPGRTAPPYGTACPAMRRARKQLTAAGRPDLPLFFTETNATWQIWRPFLTEPFIGTWLANTIRNCDGVVDMMSYWTFSDVFEEPGVMPRPFYGGFGLIGVGAIPKPSFAAFRLLHRLGEERLENAAENVLVTRRKDGTLVAAVWNRVAPREVGGPIEVALQVAGVGSDGKARVLRTDAEHGNAKPAFERMGSPVYPTPAQVQELRRVALADAPEDFGLESLRVVVPVNGIALVEIPAPAGTTDR